MSKAVNSRTGSCISQRMVRSFEQAEIIRSDELEKVRLRNISLRTTLKKLERTLRAKGLLNKINLLICQFIFNLI